MQMYMVMKWPIDLPKKQREATEPNTDSPEYPKAPYTTKLQKKPSKNGKNIGKYHPRQRQQNSISQESWTE